jgi:hypothetical protein
MTVPRPLAAALAAVALASAFLSAPSRAAGPTEWRLTTRGFGPARVGMTADELSAALGTKVIVDAPLDEGENCQYAKAERGLDGVAFMMIDGRVARVDVESKEYATASGARVGMTEREVKALYRGRLRVSPHHYTDGHYLTYVPRDARDKNYRVVFETDGKVVTGVRVGRLPEVEYVEGCA